MRVQPRSSLPHCAGPIGSMSKEMCVWMYRLLASWTNPSKYQYKAAALEDKLITHWMPRRRSIHSGQCHKIVLAKHF